MTNELRTSVLFLVCFIPVCFSNIFHCSCGEIVNGSPYLEGERMTLTCVITDTGYFGGINSSQLYFLHGDREVKGQVINSTALTYSKNVTLRDQGMYRCKIRTNREVSLDKTTVMGDKVDVFVKIKFNNIDCKLYYWKQLRCSWERNHQKQYPEVEIILQSPNGDIIKPDSLKETFGSWNIDGKLDTSSNKGWNLSMTQRFPKRVLSSDIFQFYPLKHVIPAPVEDLAVDIIKNNATCLRLMWSYDLYENYKKSFSITYECGSCSNKISTLVVDKTNITVCDLETGSPYNFSVRVKSVGGYLSDPVTVEQTTLTTEVTVTTVSKAMDNDKIIALTVGLIVAAIFAAVGLCYIIRKCKGKVTDFCRPLEFDDPSIMQETKYKNQSCGLGNACQSPGGSVESTSSEESEKAPFIKNSKQGCHIPIENCSLHIESEKKIEQNMDGNEDDNDGIEIKRFDNLNKNNSFVTENSNKANKHKLGNKDLKQNFDTSNVSLNTDVSTDRRGNNACEDYSKVGELSDYSGQIESDDEMSSFDHSADLTSHNTEVVDHSAQSFDSFRDPYSHPQRKYCETSSDSSDDEYS